MYGMYSSDPPFLSVSHRLPLRPLRALSHPVARETQTIFHHMFGWAAVCNALRQSREQIIHPKTRMICSFFFQASAATQQKAKQSSIHIVILSLILIKSSTRRRARMYGTWFPRDLVLSPLPSLAFCITKTWFEQRVHNIKCTKSALCFPQ